MSILFRRCCSPPAPWPPSCSCRPRPPPASPPGPAGWSWEGRRWGPSTPARIYTSEVGNLIFDRNYLGIAWGHSSEYCLLIITWLWTLEMEKFSEICGHKNLPENASLRQVEVGEVGGDWETRQDVDKAELSPSVGSRNYRTFAENIPQRLSGLQESCHQWTWVRNISFFWNCT